MIFKRLYKIESYLEERHNLLLSLIVFLLISSSFNVFAQQIPNINSPDSTTSVLQEAIDPLGRSNPKEAVAGFFKAITNNDYVRAAKYLDFSAIAATDNDSIHASYVQKIEILLNKYGTVDPLSIITADAEGDLNDGLPSELEAIGTIELNGVTKPLYLELITSDSSEKLWLVSRQTTTELITYINSSGSKYDQDTSDSMFSTRWKGAPIYDWLAIVLLAFSAYFIAWLITIVLKWLFRTFSPNLEHGKYTKLVKTLLIPLRLILMVLIILYAARLLELSIVVRQKFSVVNLIAIWTAVFIFIWLLIDTLTSFGKERLLEKKSFAGLSAISFFRNSAKVLLIVVAVLIAFDTLGFNVTAGLAALGVGGIALALGAQKTVENIVGGLSVVFDQPVSVGDFCKFGDTLGTVEGIGIRSTRIRTLNRTVVTIPNADFSSQLIENYAKRDLFLYHTKIGLRYETSSDQMRFILVELRKILYAHPKVNPDPARVRFLGYGSDCLNVELFAYVHAVDWNDFLAIQEDIHLRLAKVIEDSGSGFAFPSQTLYLSKDMGLSEKRKEQTEAKVKQWIENDELKLPHFDQESIDQLKGSIAYPPKSSADSRE